MENRTAMYGALGLVGFLLCLQFTRGTSKLSLPPGPKPLPVLGNIRDLPPAGYLEYLHWLKHKDLHGPVSSITVMGQTIVIIHDKHLAHEILEKESLKTAERPSTEMASQLRARTSIMSNLPFDSVLRYQRKLFHQQMGTKKAVEGFQDTQEVESKRFLLSILHRPEDLLQHIPRVSRATILRMTYGYSQRFGGTDPLVKLIEAFLKRSIIALTPGTWLVDILPVVKYLPEWCPGTGFAKFIRNLVKDWTDLENIPCDFVQGQMKNGTNRPSYVSKLIEDNLGKKIGAKLAAEDEAAIKSTAAIMYSGAVETTTLTLNVFVLAMMKFPDVQRKAQEEIDRVTGTGRLPGFEDRNSLPYIEAIITETLRWFPSLPMGFPHMAGQEIIAGGYRIPKFAVLMPAVYWFTHDPEVYPNPDSFEPERHLSPRNEADPRQSVFGYGRRICPGRHFANASLYLDIAQTLAVFNISKAVDAHGNEIELELQPEPGILTHLKPFPFKITPRSEKHAELIQSLGDDLLAEDDDSKLLDISGTCAAEW